MAETESNRLINAIKKHPCLWDLGHADYHNRDVKDTAWDQICEEVESNWKQFGTVKKLNIGNNLKKKWTHIRDYYRKDLLKFNKYAMSGSRGIKKQRRYMYTPHLDFLRPFFEKRKLQGFYNDNKEDRNKGVNSGDDDNVLVINETVNDIQRPVPSRPCVIKTVIKPKPKVNIQQIIAKAKMAQTKIDPTIKILKILETMQKPCAEDDNVKFLLSFRDDMNKMNSSQKFNFKVGMLELVKKINEEEQQPPQKIQELFLIRDEPYKQQEDIVIKTEACDE